MFTPQKIKGLGKEEKEKGKAEDCITSTDSAATSPVVLIRKPPNKKKRIVEREIPNTGGSKSNF